MTDQAVCDSTCLIALEGIGQLSILPKVFQRLYAPPEVISELGASFDWLIGKEVANIPLMQALRTQLDVGESAAIALAKELGDVLVILDDKKARRVGRQMGLRVVGTVGVLLRAKHSGAIPAVAPASSRFSKWASG